MWEQVINTPQKRIFSIPHEKLHFAPSGIGGISPLGAGRRNSSAWCRPEESSRALLEQSMREL
ncbi:hypothetical protein [Paenibacillus sp. FSL R7-0026]|uniref:hypothetical protein n=1 Tax=Paenibacillus sp. FSL R7-0026 TaxID=2921668 RepID=UPI0030FA73EA